MKAIVWALLAGAVSLSGASQAEVLSGRSEDGSQWCVLQGDISDDDVAEVRAAVALGCRNLQINSAGGSVAAAMKIGRALRSAEAWVTVPTYGRCASACVLIYAGGVIRVNYGPIQIHRPYSLNPDSSLSKAQQRFASMERDVRSYLRAMNVSQMLFDRMVRVAPDRIEQPQLQ
jgi:hypothetical protein